jgi:hypothetical protein
MNDDYGICIICGRIARGSLLCDECEERQPENGNGKDIEVKG